MSFIPADVLRRAPALGFAFAAKDKLAISTAGASVLENGFDDAKLCERGVISLETPDRVGDVVVSAGGDWTDFAKSPSVFFNHQSEWLPIPIGQACDPEDPERRCTIQPEPGRILATTYYARSIPEGAQFYAMSKEGILRGYSIGFDPLTEPVRLPATSDNPNPGFRYDRWRGLEYSKVGLPCHPGAVTLAEPAAERLRDLLDAGKIAGERINPLVRKSLLPLAAKPRGVWRGWTKSGGFREEDHPRGQPDNAGQFTSGGGAANKPDKKSGDEPGVGSAAPGSGAQSSSEIRVQFLDTLPDDSAVRNRGLKPKKLKPAERQQIETAHRNLTSKLKPEFARLLANIPVAGADMKELGHAGNALILADKKDAMVILLDPKNFKIPKSEQHLFADPTPDGIVRHELAHDLEGQISLKFGWEWFRDIGWNTSSFVASEYGSTKRRENWAEFVTLITKPGFDRNSLPADARKVADALLASPGGKADKADSKADKKADKRPAATCGLKKVDGLWHNKRKSFTRAISSTSGPAGGYTVSPELPVDASSEATQDSLRDPAAQLKEAVAAAAAEHFGANATGHVIHLHPESGAVHHSHPVDYDVDKLAKFKEVCEGIDGITSVHQEADKAVPPDGEGWEHAFGVDGKDAEMPDEDMEAKRQAKAAALVKTMPAFVLTNFLEGMKAKASDTLQECVSRKIPKLLDEGYEQDQAAAIAYSMCGETKALDEAGGLDRHTAGGMNPEEDATDEAVPHGVAHAMKALKLHGDELPRMHPNDKTFYKSVMSMLREHAKAEYPDHADHFGDDGDEDNPPETGVESEDSQDKTEEALAPYKAARPLLVKRLRRNLLKRMHAAHHKACKEATDHLGELAQLPVGQKWMGSHKSATCAHHKAMSAVCKEMEVDGVEEEGPEAEGDPLEPLKSYDLEALGAALAKGSAELIKPELYAITGRREHKPNGEFGRAK